MPQLRLRTYDTDGHRVRLEWDAEGLPSIFRSHDVEFRYDSTPTVDVDTAAFMFMNLIVPCYAAETSEHIELEFPRPINANLVEPLATYHRLDNVSVDSSSLRTVEPSRWAAMAARARHRRGNYALLYGGGKDSLLSAAIHADVYGADNVSLVRLVWDVDADKLQAKREIFESTMSFMERRGFSTHFIQSNFHSQVSTRGIGKTPSIGLYHAALAPLMPSLRFRQIAHGLDASEFHEPTRPGGPVPFAKTRPEGLLHLRNAHEALWPHRVDIKNFNYAINPNVAFKMLVSCYPEYVENVYMCERLGQRWCIKCRKCFLYALACLAHEIPCDFGLGYFFETSSYIAALVDEIEQAETSVGAMPPYSERFSYRNHVCSTVQIVNSIDRDYARGVVTHPRYPNAWSRLEAILDHYQDLEFPDYDSFWLAAHDHDASILSNDRRGSTRRQLLKSLAAQQIPVSTKRDFAGFSRDTPVVYHYEVDTTR